MRAPPSCRKKYEKKSPRWKTREGWVCKGRQKKNRKLYPPNWKELVAQRKWKTGNKCEICDAKNYEPHPITGSKVFLTLVRLTNDPTKNEPWELALLCQRCQLRIDRRFHIKNRKLKKEMSK